MSSGFEPTARYAVYWVPARAHPLWAAGCAWLGRDPELGEAGTAPAWGAEPWRYGFHATLKAPLRLREGCSEAAFCAAVAKLAARQARFAMPALRVDWLDGFLALRPEQPPAAAHPLRQLADACVTSLDEFRATMGAPELARRAAGLAEAQLAALQRWGYPHVLQHWRFHMTLSDRLPPEPAALQQRAEAAFAAALAQPLMLEEVSVFVEARPGTPLRLLQRFKLGD
ncbi:DUF1045 domain-containing protein [Paucibacter sp. APW11]|uniref:DUF1045 domain-containing protein n=1 Tax=Roseateles aquae TaxID=3077235 RepID=A0ABU3PI55_9BURK|nr:DUF1045 domain-containing protein [Paucibacter sp. APW11]MDT9002261.1 DUF1045 domain-containing protein [Paucibacter sp. APW11]